MVKPRDWDLVCSLCSAGSPPKTSRIRAGLPTNAGRSPLSLLLLLSLTAGAAVVAAATATTAVDATESDPPGRDQ